MVTSGGVFGRLAFYCCLQVLNLIAWSRSVNVTVARDANVLEPLLDRLGGRTS
jgi:hypothetical protein